MRTVAADNVDAPFAAHKHLVPCEHRLMRKRVAETLVEIHHHFCDAVFGRWYPPPIAAKTELRTEGRLNAVAVERLAFDGRGLVRFVADQLDLEHVLVVRTDMFEGADEL